MKILDTLAEALEEKLKNDRMARQIWAYTGFTGEKAEELLDLILKWHYVSQDKEIKRRLANFGLSVDTKEDV